VRIWEKAARVGEQLKPKIWGLPPFAFRIDCFVTTGVFFGVVVVAMLILD
jgi:hypothetical protein